ncbi:ABC transporter ATP-binding protein [Gammaproteobacteria bacterium]|nr:ABC transporter ATP-binding protein [Gammaproteobacteria bacterium]
MSNDKLNLQSVKISLDSKVILDDVNLKIDTGEIVSLMGSSASGKTSLIRSIAGFHNISSGMIQIDGQIVDDSIRRSDVAMRNVGVIFQDLALFPHLTVRENICFGLNNVDSAQQQNRAKKLEDLLDIENITNRYPNQISGGQQQRVAIARAIAPKPNLLLLDEPFSALDYELKDNLMNDIMKLIKSENITAILITHSAEEAFKMSDKIAFISNNTITQFANPYDIYHRPVSKEIANFFGISSYIKAKITDSSHINCILGDFVGMVDQFNKDDKVDLLIRPDDIIHDDDSLFSAKVTEKTFRGSDFLYELELKDGQKIFCYAPSHHNHQVNEVIGIKLDLDHLVIF